MGDENPIRTIGDYSKPSHEGYMNIHQAPAGNNVDLLVRTPFSVGAKWNAQSMTSIEIQTTTSRISKQVDLHLTLTVKIGKERVCIYFNFPLAIKLAIGFERLLAGSFTTWEDLTTLNRHLLNSFTRRTPQNS
ncbi:hypothetical protein Tco_0878272 [Tanacetum coccineum]|uniref:Uncharacterized protein n=1 Tax=Tanacetum coccineum TaxID=301880 RepID=A0ABQ5BXI3_9ASTR